MVYEGKTYRITMDYVYEVGGVVNDIMRDKKMLVTKVTDRFEEGENSVYHRVVEGRVLDMTVEEIEILKKAGYTNPLENWEDWEANLIPVEGDEVKELHLVVFDNHKELGGDQFGYQPHTAGVYEDKTAADKLARQYKDAKVITLPLNFPVDMIIGSYVE